MTQDDRPIIGSGNPNDLEMIFRTAVEELERVKYAYCINDTLTKKECRVRITSIAVAIREALDMWLGEKLAPTVSEMRDYEAKHLYKMAKKRTKQEEGHSL